MDILAEDYKHAKKELITTIELQFKILSILITATAAVFVYILDRDENDMRQIVFCACLIVPGMFAFFGTLWLDQVYRQRRLAAFIYKIEDMYQYEGDWYSGWEHFVQGNRKVQKLNWPSRYYYHICLGLFMFFPPATYILACIFKAGNVLNIHHELHVPAVFGIVLYFVFLIFAILYIHSILSLVDSFRSTELDSKHKDAVNVQMH